jgi:predicted SnoaL-like aldol condensation-catalyzing enzyme
MKKFLSLFAVAILFSCVSCNNDKDEKTASSESTSTEKKDNSKAEKNLAAFHEVTKAFDSGDPAKIDDVVASDFVDHSEQGNKNRDSLKAMILGMKADVKDGKTEIIKELADDDYVFGWLRFTGTSGGKSGMPAGPYDMTSVEVVKFKDGKAVEHWAFMDPADMMKMMPPAGKK